MNLDLDPELAELKVPPHSIESEQSVIGSLLIDNNAWDRIADFIVESDFYRYDHRLIFEKITHLITQGKPADVVTIYNELTISGKKEVGGLAYLNSLAQSTPSAANIRRYAEIVRDRATLRQLISIADEISAQAFRPQGKEVRQLLDEAESKIFAIAEQGTRNIQGFIELRHVLTQVVARVDELHHQNNPNEVTGIPTGFIDLDKITSGLQAGDLIVVAGRPSMGKTAFSLNIAENIALEMGLPVAVFSMEMSSAQLASRTLGSVGRIDQQRLRSGRLNDVEWPKMVDTVKKLGETQLFIDDTPALNPIEMRARARRLARQCGKLGLIVVDYLQLMSTPSTGENRATEISEISRSLKALAKELSVPIMALSQLNRSLEQRPNKRPMMSDLRESGAIEQDADVILFIYRDEVYNPDTREKNTAEIIIGKQRNGPTGTIRLTWQGQYTKFDNFAPMSS